MWIILLLTLVLITLIVWPVFFVYNFRQIIKRETMLFLATFFLFIDQASKYMLVSNMNRGETIPLSSWFHITYVQNHGAAFGLFQHKLYLFIGVAILSVIVIVYYSRYLARDNRWVQVALAFLLSGAVGNMIDRLQYGYVVDFLDFRFWPVFNFADIVINIGVGMLLVEMFWEQQEDEEDEEILDGGMTSA